MAEPKSSAVEGREGNEEGRFLSSCPIVGCERIVVFAPDAAGRSNHQPWVLATFDRHATAGRNALHPTPLSYCVVAWLLAGCCVAAAAAGGFAPLTSEVN